MNSIETLLNHKVEALANLIKQIWDEDVTYTEATEDFTTNEVHQMATFVWNYERILANGIPLPGESVVFDVCSKEEPGCILLNKMIAKFE